MAPTVEVDTSSSSSPSSTTSSAAGRGRSNKCVDQSEVEVYQRPAVRDPFDLVLTLDDCDNSCETYFCCRDVTPSTRSVIPEASPAFMEAMGRLKLETSTDERQDNKTNASTTSSIRPSSSSNKSKSSSSTTRPSSSHLSPTSAETSSVKSSSAVKTGSTRRPASFGGADVVKPRAGRRASHCEKRVSWADERGSDHQLISVRLIRPRLAKEVKTGTQSTPKHSILRSSGTC